MGDKATYTVREVAERLCVSVDTVRVWIRSGQLRGINVSAHRRSMKPRFVVRKEDLEAFEAARMTAPPPKPRRRIPPMDGVIDIFK